MTRVDTRAFMDGHCAVREPPDTLYWVDVQDETSAAAVRMARGSGDTNGRAPSRPIPHVRPLGSHEDSLSGLRSMAMLTILLSRQAGYLLMLMGLRT